MTQHLFRAAKFTRGGVVAVVLLLPFSLVKAAPKPADAGKDVAPLADRVPANAVIYLGWRGADALEPAYEGSRLKPVVDATDWNQIFDPFLPRLIERVEKENKDAAATIRTVLKIGKPMWKRPAAFFFTGIDWHGANGMPTPHLALICDAGADAESLEKELTEAVGEGLKDAPPQVSAEIKVMRMGDVVAVVAGYDKAMFPNVAKVADASLAADAGFKPVFGHIGGRGAVMGYVDCDRLLDVINTGVERQGDAQAKLNWPKLRDASGIAGLKHIAWSSGFDGKDWVDQAFISAPAPRKGIVALMDGKPITDEALQLIPRTATLAGVARFDAGQTLDLLRGFLGDVDPHARGQLDEVLKGASDAAGINIEDGLLKSLGDEWVYYTDPGTGGRGVAGGVLVNRLRDPAKFDEALSGLQKFAAAMLAEQTKGEQFKATFFTTKSGDLTIHYVGLPVITPSWTIHDGNLYLALFPQVVVAATDHVAGKSKSILDNPDFAALRQRIGAESPSSVQFMDLPRTAPDAWPQWLMLSRLSGFADLFGVQSPAMLAPPLSRLLPQLTAAGSATWVDNDGWHTKAVSPFPGSTALATDPFSELFGMQPLIWALAMPRAMAVPEPKPVEINPPAAIDPKIGPPDEIKPPPIIEPKFDPPPLPKIVPPDPQQK